MVEREQLQDAGLGLEPEKSWTKRHPAVFTILIIIMIAIAGMGVKFLQEKYFPFEKKSELQKAVFVPDPFTEVNEMFNENSVLSEEEKDDIFKYNYRFNAFKWTGEVTSCKKVAGKYIMKVMNHPNGISHDAEIIMKEPCLDLYPGQMVTYTFQMLSRSAGAVFIGRSGQIEEVDVI